jgi:DNA-3-methyladenine glycosylase
MSSRRSPRRSPPLADHDLSRTFARARLAGSTLDAARALIGARLARDDRAGRIVEVEAYIGTDDQASHARFGRTARNAVMFGPPGIAYVYLVYGMYDCLNVVTEPEGRPAALLIRAIEPVSGEAAMRHARLEAAVRRGHTEGPAGIAAVARRIEAIPSARLASGPGLAAIAFGLSRADTGLDLLDPRSPIRLEPAPAEAATPPIATSARIGIAYAPEPWRSVAWRFFDPTSAAVSGR